MPTEATAVTSEQPALIQRRLRRSLKNRSQVSNSSVDEGDAGDGVGGVVVVEAWRVCIDLDAICCVFGDCTFLDVQVLGLAKVVMLFSPVLHVRAVCLLKAALAMMGDTARGIERRHAVVDRGKNRAAMSYAWMELRWDANGWSSRCFSSKLEVDRGKWSSPSRQAGCRAACEIPRLHLLFPISCDIYTRSTTFPG